VVYLEAKPETVYERLKKDTTRPLLAGGDPMGRIRALLTERGDVYRAAADVTVCVDGKGFDEILREIEEKTK